MKINKDIQQLFRALVSICGAALLGMVLLWVVYLLPTEEMVKNVIASENTLKAQEDTEYFKTFQFSKVYDTHTNMIMLHEIIYSNYENALQAAMLAPTIDWREKLDEYEQIETLIEYARTGVYDGDDYKTYARYWHGYLVVLKPLFMFFELQEIYQLNAGSQILLMVLVFYLMRKRLGNYCFAYLLAVFTLQPLSVAQSFQLSTVFYIVHVLLFLLLRKKNQKEETIQVVFLFGGILVAFFDFLTYPLVAVAIPLLTYFLLYCKCNYIENIKAFFEKGLLFGFGYIGMWGMKWILASVLTNENVIYDAAYSILHRTGVVEKKVDSLYLQVSVKDALFNNLYSFFNDTNKGILMVALCVVVGYCIFKKVKKININKPLVMMCVMIGILPILWFIILKNHCSLHPHLEWRTLSVTVYSLVVLVISFLEKKQSISEKGDTNG